MADIKFDFNIADKYPGFAKAGVGFRMARIAGDLTELVGNTPLLKLERFAARSGATGEIVAKLEYFNPLGSAKDRVALNMIEQAEKDGKLSPGSVIIEPTSGNTGIGLAFAGLLKGYKVIIVMPENMSDERKKLVKALGAELVLTPANDGIKASVLKADEIAKNYENAFIPDQFNNPANADAHRKTTAVEILRDTYGKIDCFVAAVGTGGTLCGTASVLKAFNPEIKVFGVEPAESPVLKGGAPGKHGIQGIGANFVPGNFDPSVVDEIIDVNTAQAIGAAKRVAETEGLLVGISSGAALYAAAEIARRPEYRNKRVVVVLPDGGERYMSTELFGN